MSSLFAFRQIPLKLLHIYDDIQLIDFVIVLTFPLFLLLASFYHILFLAKYL